MVSMGLKTLKPYGEILISHPTNEDLLFFSHQTSSIKHHVTETHEHTFEMHNIVLSSESISLKQTDDRASAWRVHSIEPCMVPMCEKIDFRNLPKWRRAELRITPYTASQTTNVPLDHINGALHIDLHWSTNTYTVLKTKATFKNTPNYRQL